MSMSAKDFQRYHQPKQCKFCPNPVPYTPLNEMEEYGVKVYFCHHCQAEYLYWGGDNQASCSIYITHNGKMYRWTVSYSGLGQLWYIKNPGIPGTRKNQNLELLASFKENIPNITPANFLAKLSTYLVFL